MAGAAVLLAGAGCHSGRLPGPDYAASRASFVASDLPSAPTGPAERIHRIILIGDAGDPARDEPTLADVGRWGDEAPERTTVVFLGDNVYPKGLRDRDRDHGEAVLRQLVGSTRASRIFVPGNHDWGMGDGKHGLEFVRNQQRFLDGLRDRGVDFAPRDGCPGPAWRTLVYAGGDLERAVHLALIDIQWWLLPEQDRPPCVGREGGPPFRQRLAAGLLERRDDHVIVAAHHPLRSGGPHAGLSRGPIADALLQLYWWAGGSLEDLDDADYREAAGVLERGLAASPPLVYAGGHDHSLQLIAGRDGPPLYLVSGAGSTSKITTVTAVEGTRFAHAHPGFLVLDFQRGAAGDQVVLRVVETGRDAPVLEVDLLRLLASAPGVPLSGRERGRVPDAARVE